MSFVNNVNRILNAKSTGIFLFGFTGAYKALTDYQRAPKEEKKKVLLRDSAILAGSAAGLAVYGSARNNFVNSAFKKSASKFIDNSFDNFKQTKMGKNLSKSLGKYFKKPLEIVAQNSYNIAKDCIDNVLMVASGILGAVSADYLIQIGHSHKKMVDKTIEKHLGIKPNKKENVKAKKPVEQPKTPKQTKIDISKKHIDSMDKFKEKFKEKITINELKQFDKIVDEETQKNILSNITNMPEMRIFNTTMIGLQSFEVAEEKTFRDKLKHTTKSLVTNTLVPMFFLSLASNITKGMKSVYRIPLVFTTMVAGTMLANKKLGNKFDGKL